MGNKTRFKYGLDDRLPFSEGLLYGLQWLAVTIPPVVILGNVVARLHFTDLLGQVNYMQKLFFVTAVTLLVQIFWGHRLPLIVGPAAVLFVGITASQGRDIDAVYSAILIGGVVLAIISASGLFAHLEKLLTSRVIATILVLIAFTITPSILNLIFTVPVSGMEFTHLCFALILVLAMFGANKLLTGIWKSTLIIWSIVAGSLLYRFIVPQYQWLNTHQFKSFSNFFTDLGFRFTLDSGLLISFLICFLALAINDLGSIQSIGEIIRPSRMGNRITAGITITGLANILSGFLGVIGPVNFVLSAGIIAAHGVASRFALVPTGIGLLAISFLPKVVALISNLPPVIVGVLLLYIMCTQVSAGLLIAFKSHQFSFEDGLIIALSLMLAIIVSFLPSEALVTFPPLLIPIIGNGFSVGVLTVLFMEHVIYRR